MKPESSGLVTYDLPFKERFSSMVHCSHASAVYYEGRLDSTLRGGDGVQSA